MSSIEQRIERLERQSTTSEGHYVRWIIVRSCAEAGPTENEIQEAEAAYIERLGEPKGVGIMEFFNGVASAKGVELTKYKYEPSHTTDRPFKEIRGQDG